MSDSKVVTTPKQLKSLGQDALVMDRHNYLHRVSGLLEWAGGDDVALKADFLPCALIATGDHMRAVNDALEGKR